MPADTVFLLEKLNDTLVTANMIKRWTNQNPVLAKVKNFVVKGWPSSVTDSGLHLYFNKQTQLNKAWREGVYSEVSGWLHPIQHVVHKHYTIYLVNPYY